MKLHILKNIAPLFILAAACGAYRLVASPPAAKEPVLRDRPWTVGPRYDIQEIATDEQLLAVLDRMKPPKGKPNTNVLVHALRLWGATVDFGDPTIPSGPTMRNYFLHDADFRKLAGEDAPPLFTLDPDGVRVRPALMKDPHEATGAVHVDDLLATLAETNTPLSQPLETRNGTANVGELLRGTLNRFHLEQQEFEWSAISYARYVFPNQNWTNVHGQKTTVEELVDDLIHHPLEEGVCGGTHRIEALVVLLRADEQAHALAPRTKKRIVEHLGKIVSLLMQSQAPDGHWTRTWTRGALPRADYKGESGEEILLTGHHLEWLALAPPEVQPPRETMVRAGQWLVRAMLEVDDASLQKMYGPFSHAARALCLWRSKEPALAWKSE
jgi:hypothetical protein